MNDALRRDALLDERFSVARELGMTFDEVCQMDRWELAHWIAKLRLDPSPTQALTLIGAMLASVTVNSAFGSSGKAKASDFYIDWRAKPPTPEVQALIEQDAWLRWVNTAQTAK